MNRSAHGLPQGLVVLFAVLISAGALAAQTQTPMPRTTLVEQAPSQNTTALPPPHGFQQFIKSGKLQLSLNDAIFLALANNTDIQVDQTQVDTAKAAIGSAHALRPNSQRPVQHRALNRELILGGRRSPNSKRTHPDIRTGFFTDLRNRNERPDLR